MAAGLYPSLVQTAQNTLAPSGLSNRCTLTDRTGCSLAMQQAVRDMPPLVLPRFWIEIKTGKIEIIKGGRFLEKARFVGRNGAQPLPAPATGNLAHRHPVEFHIFLKIRDYYVCHHPSPLSVRGTRRQLTRVYRQLDIACDVLPG